jgi:eukaryotic-like serine/threonine-protein kinase
MTAKQKTVPRPAAASSSSEPAAKRGAGSIVADRYRLDRHLGRGGMGTVWRGWDTQLEREVAVKFMSASALEDEGLRQRFTREAKAAAALRSKHVVDIYDDGVADGVPYIVMERLEGEDLRARLQRMGSLGLAEVVSLVAQTSKALHRARQVGVVHRDLKPANLFLAQVDDEEIVKVLDFGVAKRTRDTSHETKSGVVLGSPPYMSPEQARGRDLDHRADLWSLASIAFRALTGQAPFTGESDGDVIVKICTESAPAPSELVPAFGPAVDAVFERAFRRDPDERFQTARELTEAFSSLLGEGGPDGFSSGDGSGLAIGPDSSSQPRGQEDVDTVVSAPIDEFGEPAAAMTSDTGLEATPESGPTWTARGEMPRRSRWLLAGAAVMLGALAAFGVLGPAQPGEPLRVSGASQMVSDLELPALEPPRVVAEPTASASASPSASSRPKPSPRPSKPVTGRPGRPPPTPKPSSAWGY